jgi:hypothetical protein
LGSTGRQAGQVREESANAVAQAWMIGALTEARSAALTTYNCDRWEFRVLSALSRALAEHIADAGLELIDQDFAKSCHRVRNLLRKMDCPGALAWAGFLAVLADSIAEDLYIEEQGRQAGAAFLSAVLALKVGADTVAAHKMASYVLYSAATLVESGDKPSRAATAGEKCVDRYRLPGPGPS